MKSIFFFSILALSLECADAERVNEPVSIAQHIDQTLPENGIQPANPVNVNSIKAVTFRLATWNIRIFSNNTRNDQELRRIANVLIDYDFIAIVELRDETVLKRTERILERMGKDYDYTMSRSVGGSVKERYAFLFDSQIIDVIAEGHVFPDPNDAFLREPYLASFKAGEFDFTVIAVHVVWGDSVAKRRR